MPANRATDTPGNSRIEDRIAEVAPKVVVVESSDEAHHADNQRRLMTLENKVDENTLITQQNTAAIDKIGSDTAELVEMWKDAGVVFKWIRKIGVALIWIGKVFGAIGAVYGVWKYFGGSR
ncbi:MAG: hypothetical protein ACRYGK_19125 [Janthinobacterium lividum]